MGRAAEKLDELRFKADRLIRDGETAMPQHDPELCVSSTWLEHVQEFLSEVRNARV